MNRIVRITTLFVAALLLFVSSSSAMTIYVGNLNWTFTDDDLTNLFSQYGTVTSAKLVKDPNSGNRSKGYGFVVMPDNHQAKDAIAALNGAELQGRKIVVYEFNQSEPAHGGFKKPGSQPNVPTRFPAVPKATPEMVLDKAAAEDLVAEASDWLSDLIDDGDIEAEIAAKWEERKDLGNKTRTQILKLLLDDAKTIIADKAARDAFIKGWNLNTPQKP